jgi:hypothetical protein
MFRLWLAASFAVLLAYTAVTIGAHGWNLLPIFFGDMARMAWPGQFNLDFFLFLLLSGLWVSWRHQFRPAGLALGLVALFGGMGFLTPYLLYQSFRTRGDIAALMLGDARAAALRVA